MCTPRESGKLIASGNVHKNKVLSVAVAGDGKSLAVVGVKFVKFFSVDGRALKARAGVIGKEGKIQTFCCVEFCSDNGEEAVVGTAGGELYLFKDRQLAKIVQAHGNNEAILSIYYRADMKHLMTGGKDGLVLTWDANLKAVGVAFDITDLAGDKTADCVMTSDSAIVSVHATLGYILVGTRGGQIIELEVASKVSSPQTFKSRVLMNSHASGELHGVAAHPSRGEFVSVGEGECK